MFTYDAAGNVTIDQRGGDTYVYAYNAANRMQSVTKNGVLQAEYVYNALGQQVIRRVGGQTVHSLHDLDGNRVAEYDFDVTTQVSTLLREYIWMNGLPVAVVENGAVYYVRTDHIGRPVFATDGTGAKVWEASYLPFGGVHTSTGANINLRFPGQWFQSESGLHQNWMRDYDPTTGRYMQADPLGLVDGASIYGYARQNPGRFIDPRGTQSGILDGPQSNIPSIGDSSDIGGTVGVGIRIFGGTVGGTLGGILAATPAGVGSDAPPTLEQIASINGFCGDPCEEAKNRIRQAKRNPNLAKCTTGRLSKGVLNTGLGSAIASSRANAWHDLIIAREDAAKHCINDPKPGGHRDELAIARKAMNNCLKLVRF